MTWLRPRKPSASMIVAIIALTVAMGGTSYAAFSLPKNSVGTKQLKKNAVTSAKIKNGAVTGAKIGNGAIGTSKLGNGAVTAAKINPSGLTVPTADTGLSPVAYAHINADGTVDSSQSRGVTSANVDREYTSTYCFKGLSFKFKTALVSAENQAGGSSANDGFASVRIPSSICSPTAQVQVFTTSIAPNAYPSYAPVSFYIWFFN